MYIYINFFRDETGRTGVPSVLSSVVAPSFAGNESSDFKVLCHEKNSFIKFSSPRFITSVEENSKTAGQVQAGKWSEEGGHVSSIYLDLNTRWTRCNDFLLQAFSPEPGSVNGLSRTQRNTTGEERLTVVQGTGLKLVGVGAVGVRGTSAWSRDPPAKAASHSFQNTELPAGIMSAVTPLKSGCPPEHMAMWGVLAEVRGHGAGQGHRRL